MRIAFDIDGVVVSEYSHIFSTLIKALAQSSEFEVYIISSRENTKISRDKTKQELKDLGISYDNLILTDNKQQAIADKIDMFFDNEIEQINTVKNSAVCCLLVREEMNYCWESNRFLASKKTVRMIDQ